MPSAWLAFLLWASFSCVSVSVASERHSFEQALEQLARSAVLEEQLQQQQQLEQQPREQQQSQEQQYPQDPQEEEQPQEKQQQSLEPQHLQEQQHPEEQQHPQEHHRRDEEANDSQVEPRSYLNSAGDDAVKADLYAALRKKPLKNIFMGIYKNYKSTYLGNRTSSDYKRTLQESLGDQNAATYPPEKEVTPSTDSDLDKKPQEEEREDPSEASVHLDEAAQAFGHAERSSKLQEMIKKISRRKRKQKKRSRLPQKSAPKSPKISEYHYDIGPAMNLSLDMNTDVVRVQLKTDNLKQVLGRRWLGRGAVESRGKKNDMLMRVLPLFIIPFLIQTAVVPFLVTKLKLLLMKSILVGKLAIFLLIISAIKNSHKATQSYEVAPSYWAGEPSRRSELAAYNGYRVEGKPAAWIN